MEMAKVTFYYITHAGKGVFDNRRFKDALGKADTIDLEAFRGVPYGIRKEFKAVVAGDRKAYGRAMAGLRKAHRREKDEGVRQNIQHDLELTKLLFNSNKKIEFEEKLRGRPRYFGRVKRLFPGLRKYMYPSERKKLLEGALAAEDAGWAAEELEGYYRRVGKLEMDTLIRSLADSERIARKLRLNPAQNRLVIRGSKHFPTSDFLRDRTKARVESLHMPVPGIVADTPAHGLLPDTEQFKVMMGEPITASDLMRTRLKSRLTDIYLKRGWKTPEATAQAGFITNRVRASDLAHLGNRPREIETYLETKKFDLFAPWWKRMKASRRRR